MKVHNKLVRDKIPEMLQAICAARGYTLEETEAMRAKKADQRGGFAEKIFLEYVE